MDPVLALPRAFVFCAAVCSGAKNEEYPALDPCLSCCIAGALLIAVLEFALVSCTSTYTFN